MTHQNDPRSLGRSWAHGMNPHGAAVRAIFAAVVAAGVTFALSVPAPAQEAVTAQPATAPVSVVTDTVPAATAPAVTATTQPAEVVSAATQPATPVSTAPAAPPAPVGGPILLNFKDASIQAVLEYLSESAGLVILGGDRVEGRVTVMSRQPISTDEAVSLLDSVLREKGYAAIRAGRTLKIVSLEQAIRENLPVYAGGDPADVPVGDKLITQVIPIRYADAAKLRTDLAPLVGEGAKLTANEASNTLILVDTQANIRRIMQIIRALDEHMAAVSEVKTYRLEYADATTTARLITELLQQDDRQNQPQRSFFARMIRGARGGRGGRGGDGGSGQEGGRRQRVIASADERTNTLVVSAPPDMIEVIDGIVEKLDSDPTEEQSVFIYTLKNAQAENLETVLNNIFSDSTTSARGRATGGRSTGRGSSRFGRRSSTAGRGAVAVGAGAGDLAGQVYVVADEDTNSLLVRTASKHVDRVKEILSELDRPVPQVLIKVLIVEVTHDDTLDLGTEFSILNLQFGTSGSIGVNTRTGSISGGLVTMTMNGGMSTVFNALQRDGRMDVLSRPYILTSDNQEATIMIGQEVPFIRNSRTTDTGQIINNIEYRNVGIILKVTPQVNPEGLVIMDVAPEISSISDITVLIPGAGPMSVINERSAQTQVAVLDGQTIVIGGLMEDRIIDTVSKVPGLGDLPLLGSLFRRTTKKKVKTELLIFLTPRVAERPDQLEAMSKQVTSNLKAVRAAGGDGVFQEHMNALHSAPTTRPARSQDIDAKP